MGVNLHFDLSHFPFPLKAKCRSRSLLAGVTKVIRHTCASITTAVSENNTEPSLLFSLFSLDLYISLLSFFHFSHRPLTLFLACHICTRCAAMCDVCRCDTCQAGGFCMPGAARCAVACLMRQWCGVVWCGAKQCFLAQCCSSSSELRRDAYATHVCVLRALQHSWASLMREHVRGGRVEIRCGETETDSWSE